MGLVKRLVQIVGVLVALVVVIAVVGVVVLMTMDFNQYKNQLTAAVSEATGRSFEIDGDLTVVPSLNPTVAAEGIRFANADWGARPDMVEADRVFISLAVLPLLQGEVRVEQVRLVGADVLLETDAAGTGNWSFGPPADGAPQEQPVEAGGEPGGPAAGMPAIVLADLRIEQATLAYRDGATGQTRTLSLDHLTLGMEAADRPLQIDLEAVLDGLPLVLAGEVGSLSAALGNAAFPVSLSGRVGPAAFTVDGAIAEPQTPAGIDLTVTVQGDQIAALAEIAEAATGAAPAIPALGPYRVRTQLAGAPAALAIPDLDISLGSADRLLLSVKGAISDPTGLQGIALRLEAAARDSALLSDLAGPQAAAVVPLDVSANVAGSLAEIKLSDLAVNAAGSDLSGDVTVAPMAAPIVVSARLASRQLDLRPFQQGGAGGQNGAGDGASAEAGGDVFPDDPLPLDGLKAANADVRWTIGRIETGTATLSDTELTLALKDGVLRLAPVKTALTGGSLAAALTLDAARSDRAGLEATVDGAGFELARLLAETPSDETLTGGPITLKVDLKGAGRSVKGIVGSLDGLFQVQVGEAIIANPYLDLIAGDVLDNILNLVDPFQNKQQHTTLTCGVVRLPIRNGVAAVDESIAVQTSKIAIVADGEIDLGQETLDLAVHPYALEGVTVSVGQLANLVRLQGSFLNPRIGANVESIGKTALSVGAAIATQGGSLALESMLDQFSKDPDPCATAMGHRSAKKQAEPPALSDPGQAVEAARGQLEERARQAGGEVQKQVEEQVDRIVPKELRRAIPGGLLGNW